MRPSELRALGLQRVATTSAPINKTYSGPDIPIVYDLNWQIYNNLTAEQIAAFQAMPEWQDFTSYVALAGPAATINALVSLSTINATLSAGKIQPLPPVLKNMPTSQ